MGLRIRTNVASLKTQRRVQDSTRELRESTEKLASGHRINKAADNAAGLAVSETMTATIRSMDMAKNNANDGVSLVQVAESGLSEISNILVRLRELSVQAASDTISNRERSFLNKEYTELVDEIDRISNVTEFNGLKLFKGEPSELVIHVGTGDGLGAGNKDTINLELENWSLDPGESLGEEILYRAANWGRILSGGAIVF